ncbi:MAG: HlyD family efflux transporter periplasmic adaptor subunit [Chloroflexi bacterium]|nr:HlyD family efflux transporter periplasmic adaptor subunit [Chloroflexota bacterium]
MNLKIKLVVSLRGAQFATKQSPIRRLGIASQKTLAMTILILLLAACQPANGTTAPDNSVWTGFLEGKTLDVSAEVGGRVTSITIEEGDVVKHSQLLATIDDEFIRLRIEIADANVAAAQAQLALLEAGARAEDIRKAQARVEQAQAALIAATQTVSDTEALRANPQTLTILRADAETRAIAATLNYTATAKQAEAADLESRLWADIVKQLGEGVDVRLPGGATLHFDSPQNRRVYAQGEWNRASTTAWQAWAGLDVARANALTAYANWKDVSDQLANPIALDARVNQARAARDRAAANVLVAQAALQSLRDGASPAQIQTARAALDQARAARAALDPELARYQIAAPRDGVVTRVAYRVGEIAPAAIPVVRLSVAGDLKLRVFVPMAQVDRLRVGANATVIVNELENRQMSGTITNIAERAEFTGRAAQTDDDRNAQLVAVEITLKDADDQVKAGMPASLVIGAIPSSGIKLPALLGSAETPKYSGTLETKQTRVAAEISARAIAVRVQRGSAVNVGDVLIELDDAAIQNTLSEADAATRAAQSNLDQVNEKARPGTIALAEAGVAQADADLKAANAALSDANRALTTPQELLAQLHLWEGKTLAAQGDVKRAEATLNSIKNQLDGAQADQSNTGKTRYQMLLRQKEGAEAALSAAQATAQGNERVLALYRALIANPLELIAAKNSAANQVKIAEAGKKIAQAELDIAKRSAQREAVALAEAKLRAAQASQKIAQAQAKRYAISSPVAGTIIGKSIEPGETVRAGAPLLTLADPRELELTIYVPIRNVGAIKVGQDVKLTVPSLPGKAFSGKVATIAPEAEFKPANLYNATERSEIVFAVRVTILDAREELKAGLPADVTIANGK